MSLTELEVAERYQGRNRTVSGEILQHVAGEFAHNRNRACLSRRAERARLA